MKNEVLSVKYNHKCKFDIVQTAADDHRRCLTRCDQIIESVRCSFIPAEEKTRIITRIRIWRGYSIRSERSVKGYAWLASYPLLRLVPKRALERSMVVNQDIGDALAAIERVLRRE